MRTYRKIVGWTFRVILIPVLVLWFLVLFTSRLLAELMEITLSFVMRFAIAIEEWEVGPQETEWRPLKESILEQRETDWVPIKPGAAGDGLDT